MINISSEEASEVFASISKSMGNDVARKSKFMLYEVPSVNGKLVHQVLQEWKIGEDDIGQKTYKVRLRVSDMNNSSIEDHTKRMYEWEMEYNCNHYEMVSLFVCIPKHCEMPPLPKPRKTVVCMNNYHNAAKLITHVYELSKGYQKKHEITPTLYDIIMKCIRQKIEKVEITGQEICYIEGFTSENEMTYQQYREAMSNDWTEVEHGKFERVVDTEILWNRTRAYTDAQTLESLPAGPEQKKIFDSIKSQVVTRINIDDHPVVTA